MVFITLGLLALMSGMIFYRTYPPFGAKTPKAQKLTSTNFKNGSFVNQIPTSMHMGFGDILSVLHDQIAGNPDRKPRQKLVPHSLPLPITTSPRQTNVTWFGHSAFLLQIHGKIILLDPMFGRSPSPFPLVGPQRFSDNLPASIDALPYIDAVAISHDHYDHLDYGSIKKLAPKVTMFFVPLGLAAHLRKWGVLPQQITELDWWDKQTFEGMTFVCTPSRHFSGRTLTDRFETLWCSWVVSSGNTNVFFSGDTGYGPHFKQIGEKYGPFDLTLLECGQYNQHWSQIHMFPEQTMQAHLDLRGKRMIPMHWGAFVLSLHGWTEPVERVLAAGLATNAHIMTPEIGQMVNFKAKTYPTKPWWQTYKTADRDTIQS